MNNKDSQGFSFDLPKGNSSIIKVIGVGGGGNNALKHMYERGIHGVDFVICNTDAQTLDNNPVSNKVQLGLTITEGLGAGADPEVGEKAALESIEDIKAALGHNTKMAFITAGMGGGTGTGAAPIVAKIAKEMGILTVGIVTVPFAFEGKRRIDQAEIGLEKLRENVDSLIVINNDKIRQQFGNLGFKQGFAKADEVLTNAAKGMAEVITAPFSINIDFRDAKSVLQNSGTALMSTGISDGDNRAEDAVKKALDSPLLNDNKITGAKDVLLLILSGTDEKFEATMDEIGLINDYVQREAGGDNNANIIFGVGTDEELGEAIKVLVIATGFNKENKKNTGPSEKIKFSLDDSLDSTHRDSPFKIREDIVVSSGSEEVEPIKDFDNGEKNVFRLEDDEEDEFDINFKSSPFSISTKTEMEKTKIETQKKEDINLFSFNDEPEPEFDSFSFDVEEEEEIESLFMEEEKPVQMTFTIKETTEEKLDVVEKSVEENNEIVKEQVGEFMVIEKKSTSNDKATERRNKLKEFNSRYKVLDKESEFENVPAFRRKNIKLNNGEGSESKINTFLHENDKGEVDIKENKFLNKDVD